MARLPSYEEATVQADWLRLASSPYVREADYRSLVLVSRRFWAVFAPLLWNDPLRAVRRAGLHPSDDIRWWFDFVFDKLEAVRPAARALVRVLDARNFATDSYHFALDHTDRTLQSSFARALTLLPSVACILLDGHPDLAIDVLMGHRPTEEQAPLSLLSLADTPHRLPHAFLAAPVLRNLVYLDLSGVPGSLRPLFQAGLTLPCLRILKLRDRQLDDETTRALASFLGTQLWSLDISDNRITDAALDALRDTCFPAGVLRTGAYFYTEGKLTWQEGSSAEYGPFVTIDESRWSETFSHPERYFVDSPIYLADARTPRLEQNQVLRSPGRAAVQGDDARQVTPVLCERDHTGTGQDIHASAGLTHLHLSGNLISAAGLERFMRLSNGQLQYVACDTLSLVAPAVAVRFWPERSHLRGLVGSADFARPVFCSNLQSLRIHHSFVTGVLSLETAGLSRLACAHVAEHVLAQRVEELYGSHAVFVPDMNPRLTSIALTRIPRRSAGPLTERLIRFLRLLSEQERVIQDTAESFRQPRRGPDLLSGLRHVRLEFEPDPMEDGVSAAEDLDAEELLNSGDRGFSFFEDEQRHARPPAEVRHGQRPKQPPPPASGDSDQSDRGAEYIVHKELWNGQSYECRVWLGPRDAVPGTAMHAYRRLVAERGVRDEVGPASPAQVRAGAPSGCFIAHLAWRLAIMPAAFVAPAPSALTGMHDVLARLKAYRLAGRTQYAEMRSRVGNGEKVKPGAPHFFWTGRLEVATQAPTAQASASQYWR